MLQSISRLTGITKDNWLKVFGIAAFWYVWFFGCLILVLLGGLYYTKAWHHNSPGISWIPEWLKLVWETYSFW